MIVQVNKKGNFSQLRLLFPTIQYALRGYPVYAPVVYTDEEYDVSDKTLLLVQSPAGYPIDTITGLIAFLTRINYMAKSKIERLSRISTFGEDHIVYNMYHEALSLKLANRSFLEEEIPDFSFKEFCSLSLYERLRRASLVGEKEVLGDPSLDCQNLISYLPEVHL